MTLRSTKSSDHYETAGDSPLAVGAPGVLKNDSDPDGGVLSATVDQGPRHGTLELEENGSFVYTPGDSFGEEGDSFTYELSDGQGGTDTATVTIGRACTVIGTPGEDQLRGTSGRAVICGLSSNDKLYGNGGDDRLILEDGVEGNDVGEGGAGRDACVSDPRDKVKGCP